MRRVLAIGLAIVIVMIASRGVVAQEADSVSDRLLEILKDRQIISNDEFGELKGLAAEMQDDRADMDRRLGDLDRSIADYLAKDGDATAAGVTYTVGNGFAFTTSDNLFSLNLGGMFQFWYEGWNGDRNSDKYISSAYGDKRDMNGFQADARFHFFGHAFTPDLKYYFEYIAWGSRGGFTQNDLQMLDDSDEPPSWYDRSGGDLGLYEGYVDYNLCNWTNIRAGQFRMPLGRQNLIHASDLTMASRAISNPLIDVGVMLHNMYTDMFGVDGLAAEYMMGLFDGSLAANNSWVAPAMRLVVYPLGPIANVEGDWKASGDPQIGVGASYAYDRGRLSEGSVYQSFWGVDGVLTWNGLYLTAEWQRIKQDITGQSHSVDCRKVRNWFIQAGFMAMPSELEIFLRYAKKGTPRGGIRNFDNVDGMHYDYQYDNAVEWAVGAAYYFEGHPLKVIVQIVSLKREIDKGTYTTDGETSEPVSHKLDDQSRLGFIVTFQLEW
jgi:hypothetical protein